MTEYRSNGGGFTDENIVLLLSHLEREILDPTFEKYGNFVRRNRKTGLTTFFGNFLTYSHVFNIVTDDPAIIKPLRRAIRMNRASPGYTVYAGVEG